MMTTTTNTNNIFKNTRYTRTRRQLNKFARKHEGETIAIAAGTGALVLVGTGTIVAGAVKGACKGVAAIKAKIDERKLAKLNQNFNNAMNAADAALNGENEANEATATAPANEEQNNEAAEKDTKPTEGTDAANAKENK